MRILAASVDAFPKMGGVSSLAHHLCNALCSAGHEVLFLGPAGTVVPSEHRREYGLIEDWESSVHKRSGEAALTEDARICALARKIIVRYNVDRVVLFHPFYYGVGFLEAVKQARLPISVYFHGFELRSQLVQGYPTSLSALVKRRKIGTLRERTLFLVGSADELLVNSSYTASLFAPLGVADKVRIVGCGLAGADVDRELDLSPQYSTAERAARREALGLPHATTIVYAGRLVPTKRVDRLLQIVQRRSEFGAVIVGDGPAQGELKNLASQLRLEGRVTFSGAVSETLKWEILRSADFACLLSEPDDQTGHVEGFGIALLEGAASGAVPVTSGTGGMTDVVLHDQSGLIVSRDDETAAEQLASYARDTSTMMRLVEQARAQLRARYTWERVANTIVKGWQ